jgi:hypothetical protein
VQKPIAETGATGCINGQSNGIGGSKFRWNAEGKNNFDMVKNY